MYITEDCKYKPYGSVIILDKLVDSKNLSDKIATAKQNYGLDKLIYDESWEVRQAVAKQGFGLDILIKDIDEDVRVEIAKHNYKLDILVNDEDPYVRQAVAEQKFGLNILINDPVWFVRNEVARQGYGLDILINDEEFIIRNTVDDYLKEHNLTIEEWCIQEGKNYSGLIEYLIKIFSIIDTLNFVKVETDSDLSIKEFFNDLSNESYEENDFIYVAPIDIRQILFKIEKSIENNNKVFKFIVKISENSFSYNIIVNITSKDIFHKILKSTLAILHEYTPLTKYICEIEEIL